MTRGERTGLVHGRAQDERMSCEEGEGTGSTASSGVGRGCPTAGVGGPRSEEQGLHADAVGIPPPLPSTPARPPLPIHKLLGATHPPVPGSGNVAAEASVRVHLGEGVQQRVPGHAHVWGEGGRGGGGRWLYIDLTAVDTTGQGGPPIHQEKLAHPGVSTCSPDSCRHPLADAKRQSVNSALTR